jgi:PPOX class probable F420-dependent enzyme
MASLSEPDVRAFLSHGTRTGKLGWTARDGRPLVAPIWFLLEGEGEDSTLVFNTGADTAKGRAMARDGRVVLCVDLQEPPFAFEQVQGTVTLSSDPDELLRTATDLAARYMGADRAAEFGQRNAVPGELVVRITPTKVVAALDMTA